MDVELMKQQIEKAFIAEELESKKKGVKMTNKISTSTVVLIILVIVAALILALVVAEVSKPAQYKACDDGITKQMSADGKVVQYTYIPASDTCKEAE